MESNMRDVQEQRSVDSNFLPAAIQECEACLWLYHAKNSISHCYLVLVNRRLCAVPLINLTFLVGDLFRVQPRRSSTAVNYTDAHVNDRPDKRSCAFE